MKPYLGLVPVQGHTRPRPYKDSTENNKFTIFQIEYIELFFINTLFSSSFTYYSYCTI